MKIEKIKKQTAKQYLKIANLMGESANFIDRFPNELSPLLQELKNKTEDQEYVKKVLSLYASMASEANKNTKELVSLFSKMKKMQIKLNPQNFDFD